MGMKKEQTLADTFEAGYRRACADAFEAGYRRACADYLSEYLIETREAQAILYNDEYEEWLEKNEPKLILVKGMWK